MKNFLLFFVFILFFAQCKKQDNKTVDLGKNYFPLAINHWQTYQVDSITVSDFTDPVSFDTVSYMIRESIDTTFLDLNNVENFRIEAHKRYANSSWFIQDIFSAKATAFNIQKVENDLRFIKLAFPVAENSSWNGNIYIDVLDEPTLDFYHTEKYEWNYQYSEVNTAMEIGAFTFDSCVVVTQIDEENLFEKKYSKEIYAKNVGLVFKELIILKTQKPPSSASFIARAENGFILRYTISDYKK